MSFFRYADLTGDGTGSKSAAVDGSVTPQILKLMPRGAERHLKVHRMIVSVGDVGSFDADKYGNGLVLANGIELGIYSQSDDSLDFDLLDGMPINTNADWAHTCHDLTLHNFGIGNEHMTVRWTFSKAGQPCSIGSEKYLGVVINDDLTGLEHHHFNFQGMEFE